MLPFGVFMLQGGPGGHPWSIGCRNCGTSMGTGDRGSFEGFVHRCSRTVEKQRWTQIENTPCHYPGTFAHGKPASGLCGTCTWKLRRTEEMRRAQQAGQQAVELERARRMLQESNAALQAARNQARAAALQANGRAAAPAAPAAPPTDAPPAPPDDPICCVCMAADKTHAFVPCGHKCVCSGCAQALMSSTRKCPMCNSPSTTTMQIYS